MKTLREDIVIEKQSKKINEDLRVFIEKVLNKYLKNKSFTIDIKEILDTDHKTRGEVGFGFSTSDELLTDIAGYLIEVFVWTSIKELYFDQEFKSEWANGITQIDAMDKFEPLVRKNNKDKYWDFELPGIDGYFEIKSRSTKNGKKSGGYRFTSNQKNDPNLNYILVNYSVSDSQLKIEEIFVK